ncbi:mitochondrial 37S ribosomal protein mS38 [Aspergillus saccharolyticus JOP 1030-1]|uniref:Small ribosomal subunit protein mS38 n=1 Tax=Aspergillus saccharolyticus JOP 1030-1 TaxID=1450539 RepID=A0A319AFG6_9EURO|nr:hypothetical protein BP01DRAFT_356571 [Aspergillus saccharolyticus JOP 1030-1]PYH45522.1 hypothetical protein BP01DRAFT_356571 [Aspergillus saccharolyticus JOP 1030-1]
MLSSSLRRAAWAPITPISGVARASSQTLTTSANNLTGSTQPVRQRRYSSSSSSNPSDGARKLECEVNSGKSTRRRGKDSVRASSKQQQQQQQTAFSRLPSVPSTQHLLPHDVQVASFFSIHRPISVSTSVPPTSTSEAFDAIFTARKPAVDDVISTLSSAVNSMEAEDDHQHYHAVLQELTERMQQQQQQGQLQHPSQTMNLTLSIEELTKRLRPFHPPPPPVPMDEVAVHTSENASEQQLLPPTTTGSNATGSYSAVLTIHESTLPDGRKTYQAHAGPFMPTKDMGITQGAAPEIVEAYIDVVDPNSHPELRYIDQQGHHINGPMQALSTKRRRRLKMKKHKFKKLLRKTRTLRRKLERS